MNQIINSSEFYAENRDLYRQFFANYSLVLSSPGGVIVSGAFSHQFGGIGIHHKIPLRNFVGLNVNRTGQVKKIHFGTFDIYQNNFQRNDPIGELEDKIHFLHEKLKQTDPNIGLEIGILNELPRRHGLDNPGVNAVNFAIAYLILSGQLDVITIELFQEIPGKVSEKDSKLIKSTVLEFHAQWIGPNNSGFGAMACLVNSCSPIAYQATKNCNVVPLCNISL
jgi:hypothetical protein